MNKIILFTFILFLTACTAQQQVSVSGSQSDKQKILETVQTQVNKVHQVKVSLSAQYLKIDHNWAYIETTGGGDPAINAVLRKTGDSWFFAKASYPCMPRCPEGMSSCADGELVCKNTLHKQFPDAPVTIFPSPDARRMVFNP